MTKTTNRTTLTYAYGDQNHRHAVTSITINSTPYSFTYDDNGNMQSGPDLTDINGIADRSSITCNADNMPKTIVHSTGGTVNLIYDGEGNRAKKTGNNYTTYYIGEHYEITDAGSTKYIFAGNLRLAKISQEGILYFHKDHLNSSTVMSDSTGIGSVETTEYMPFGSMRDHSGISASNYKFTDQELDPETGLYNYKARLYDPNIGRFITPDSIIPDPYDPQSLNRYSYCRNNPLIYVDPNGHMDVDVDTGLSNNDSKEENGGPEPDPTTTTDPTTFGFEFTVDDKFKPKNEEPNEQTQQFGCTLGTLPADMMEAAANIIHDLVLDREVRNEIGHAFGMAGKLSLEVHAFTAVKALAIYDMSTGGRLTNTAINTAMTHPQEISDFIQSAVSPGPPSPSWGGYIGTATGRLGNAIIDNIW